MAAQTLPKPPPRGHANTNKRGHDPRRHARLVNLDTNSHVDADGVEHKTTDANEPVVGPETQIAAALMGHDMMMFADHDKLKTNVHAHMKKNARHPHPNEIAGKVAKRLHALPRPPSREGSAAEEAAETPQQEAAEVRAGTEKPTKRLPLPARKAA